MRERLRGAPAIAIASIALFVAIGGGYAIGAAKIKTNEIANQAVTNKKIKKKTIKGNRVAPNALTGTQIDEATLSGAGTGRTAVGDTAASVPAASGFTSVGTLQVPAGSYVFIAKAVLAKAAAAPEAIQCRLAAGNSSDRSLAYVDPSSNETIVNTVAHTFTGSGSVAFECDNPGANQLLVTDRTITAIPVGAISTTTLP